MNNCIVLDWLTVHVKVPRIDFEAIDSTVYIVKEKMQTRHFKSIYTIYRDKDHTDEMAAFVCHPHSGILDEDSGLLKINNKYLYQQDFYEFVKSFLDHLELIFVSISRIDIALDFLRFKNNLNPENFIRRHLSGDLLKLGKSSGRIAYKVTSAKKNRMETLKFGSETSDVTYTLYNKVQELNDKKMKPWIMENWRANGWDGKKIVWRLEFSLKSNTKAVFEYDEHGESLGQILVFKELESLLKLDKIFQYHFNKYFVFVRNVKTKRKDRCPKIELFKDKMKFNFTAIQLSKKADADRSDKIFVKKLLQVHQELRGNDFDLGIISNELVSHTILNRGLKQWAKDKLNYSPTPEQERNYYERGLTSLDTHMTITNLTNKYQQSIKWETLFYRKMQQDNVAKIRMKELYKDSYKLYKKNSS